MQELLATVGTETWGRWTIAAIVGLVGIIGGWAIRYYWERRSRTPRFRHSLCVNTVMTSSNLPELIRPTLYAWDLTIINDGQVPITVTGVTCVVPRKDGPDYSQGIYHAHGNDHGKTIAPSAQIVFPGPKVALAADPWRGLTAAPLNKNATPYFRVTITGRHHVIRLSPDEVAQLIEMSGGMQV